MIKITNGANVVEVTNGAYEGIYKGQGYRPVDEAAEQKKAAKQPVAKSEPVEPDVPDDVEDEEPDGSVENEFAELEQKPIGQWSKAEVKEYAAAKGLDISGTKNANEAKAIITEYLQSQN